MSDPNKFLQHGQIFPIWFDNLVKLLGAGAGLGGVYVALIIYFGFSPKATDAGYAPRQPVPYSHALHVGKLGLDCRYCHTGVETTAHAAVPPTQTCMNCHSMVGKESVALAPIFKSYASGLPVEWLRVHDLPDYSYFNHSAHVTRGVSCVECHGRIDQMEVVEQAKPLSMGWCLECHRDPAPRLRPQSEITNFDWGVDLSDGERREIGRAIMRKNGLLDAQDNPTVRLKVMTSCSTCHR
ncbi:MAG: cytochrome c3 family protein [Planctomycetota bacterium]